MTREIHQGGNSTYVENAGIINIKPDNSKIPKYLGFLPSISEVLIGREKSLTKIRKQLISKGNILLVNGYGGVGKTTIASNYYQMYKDEYSHLIWLDASLGIYSALNHLALNLRLSFKDKMNAKECSEEIIRKILDLESTCLIIVDNANDFEDLENNYSLLRACNNCDIIITTRITKFQKANCYRLKPLNTKNALKLFNCYYKSTTKKEIKILKEIFEFIEYNTLIIELLAKHLCEANKVKKSYSIFDLKKDLQYHGILKLKKRTKIFSNYKGVKNTTLEKILEVMHDLSDLKDKERQLLSILSALPPVCISYSDFELLLPAFSGLEDNVFSLHQNGWITLESESGNDGNRTLKISPIIQEVVIHNSHEKLVESTAEVITNLLFKLDYDRITGNLINIDYLSSVKYIHYAESICASMPVIHLGVALLLDCIGTYYKTYKNLNRASFFFFKYYQITKELAQNFSENIEFKENFGIACSRLGELYVLLGQLDRAENYIENYVKVSEEICGLKKDDSGLKDSLAISYEKKGDLALQRGQVSKATEFYKKRLNLTLDLYNKTPDNSEIKNSLAVAYSKVGDAYMDVEDFHIAKELYEKRLPLSKELHEKLPDDDAYHEQLGIIYIKLGDVYRSLGNNVKALSFFEMAIAVFSTLQTLNEFNQGYMNNLGGAYSKVGEIYSALKDFDKALEMYHLNMTISSKIYKINPYHTGFMNNLILSYEKLGTIHSSLGNKRQAMKYHKEEVQLAEELCKLGPDNIFYKEGLMFSYTNLGDVLFDAGKYKDALDLYLKRLNISERFSESHVNSKKFKRYNADSHYKLSNAYVCLGDFYKALNHLFSFSSTFGELYDAEPENKYFAKQYLIGLLKTTLFYRDLLKDKVKAHSFLEEAQNLWSGISGRISDISYFGENLNISEQTLDDL